VHSLASILTAKAGKDMYCEKPCSTNIADSVALAETMRRYSRVYQAGTQRRNVSNFMFAAELARSGKLGKLHTVHANTLAPGTKLGWLPAEPEPAKDVCDWDMWLGPCPWRPTTRGTSRGNGAVISTSTAAASSSGVPTPSISASGRTTPTRRCRSSTSQRREAASPATRTG